MSNEAACESRDDSPLITAEHTNDASDSSPDPPRRAAPFIRLRSGSGKMLAQKNTEPDSPEGSSPFWLHSPPPPRGKLPMPRKLFPSAGDRDSEYTKILLKRTLNAPLEPLVSKKARVFIEANCESEDDESENSVDLSPRSTTSEAQPPPDDAPFEPIFDYAALRRRRRGVDSPNDMPMGPRLAPLQDIKCEGEDGVDTGVQCD